MARKLSFSYYPWISQKLVDEPLKQAIARFVQLLNDALRSMPGNDLEIDAPVVFDVPKQMEDIKTSPVGVVGKIALMNPLGYLLARKNNTGQVDEQVKAIAVVLRLESGKPPNEAKAVPTYKSQLYTNVNTGISTLEQVRGRLLGFGSSHSTSNFLVPAAHLLTKGIHPLSAFKQVEFTGGHKEAALAVYKGKLEVGAGHDGVIVDLASEFKDATKVLKTIEGGWSEDIPSDPVVMNAPDAERERIFKALVKVAAPNKPDSEGNAAVESFWGTKQGFETILPDAYDVLFKSMKLLNLEQKDLMK
jgi:ABC-type phosphate/phosphonate transport system substrate-binding protein